MFNIFQFFFLTLYTFYLTFIFPFLEILYFYSWHFFSSFSVGDIMDRPHPRHTHQARVLVFFTLEISGKTEQIANMLKFQWKVYFKKTCWGNEQCTWPAVPDISFVFLFYRSNIFPPLGDASAPDEQENIIVTHVVPIICIPLFLDRTSSPTRRCQWARRARPTRWPRASHCYSIRSVLVR